MCVYTYIHACGSACRRQRLVSVYPEAVLFSVRFLPVASLLLCRRSSTYPPLPLSSRALRPFVRRRRRRHLLSSPLSFFLSLCLSLPFRLLPSRFSSLRSFVLLSFFSFPSSLFFRFPSLSALLSSPISSLSLCPKTIGQLYDHRMHDETAAVDIVSSPVLFVVATAAAVVVVVIVVVNSVALVSAEVPTPRFRRPRRG